MNDLISRQSALTQISIAESYGPDSTIAALSACYQGILNLPPAQQWIPCNERLPEYGVDPYNVLCCDVRGNQIIGNAFADADHSDTGFSAESEGEFMYDCIAWMPLPEPYKMVGEDG